MNINCMVLIIKLFEKYELFEILSIFLSQANNTIAIFGKSFWNFLSSMLFTFIRVWLSYYFGLRVSDESYVDETCAWRIKL